MEKQTFNLHTHTARCGHAEGLDIQYIHSAIDAGFALLGFSEHIPFKELRLSNCRMFYEHKYEYMATLRSLQAAYQNQIDIKIGYEIEYLEDHIDYLMDMRKQCDFMILGQHCKYIGYEYDCYCNDEDVLTYVKQMEDAAKLNILTYIAHPDYFMLGRRTWSKVCQEAAHRIAKVSITYDLPLEINLNGFRYGKKDYHFMTNQAYAESRYPYPFKEFWEIISSYGCKVIYGYDAHSPITLLERDREALANRTLSDIPLNFISSIELK